MKKNMSLSLIWWGSITNPNLIGMNDIIELSWIQLHSILHIIEKI